MNHGDHKLTHCPNCNQPLAAKDHYCRNCGQSTRDLKVPFKHLVLEGLEGIFHLDSNIFRTIWALLFKPGYLTSEFMAGRRKKYVPPVRLYIFISFIFFLLLAFNPAKHQATGEGQLSESEKQDFFDSDLFHLTFNDIKSDELKGLNENQIDSLMAARNIAPTLINKYMARRLAYMATPGKAEFKHQMQKGFSYMMFVLMPIFALILYIFYRKRVKYYIECLIFSIHLHSFIFMLMIIYIVSGWIIDSQYVFLAAILLMAIYFYLSLRKAFGQSRIRTFIKTMAIGILHLFSFIICFLVMIIINVAIL